MEIPVYRFIDGMSILGMTCDEPTFDYENWASIDHLLPSFFARLTAYDRQFPGRLHEVKMAWQYVLNLNNFDIGEYVESELNVVLPYPAVEFLIYVWQRLFPNEPWQRQYPADATVKWQEQ